ncbi:hypothetical protein NHJ13734_003880 [Beauveria thailandica]
MTYQGALPPGQGYPGQGDLYSGGGGGVASQQAGYAYQQPQHHHGQHHQMQQQQPQPQQPPQHQFAQQNGSHHNASSLYANSMSQTQYYQPQQGQHGQPQHQRQQNHHQFQQQQHYQQQQQQQRQHPQQQHTAQMQQFGAGAGASMSGGVYHGSFQQSFPQHPQQQQQSDVRQFAQSNDLWRQSQSPSIQHAMTPSQMQATVMQQQRSQQQHLQQLQQMQHTQQQSPQLYNASIASPQIHNQSRPSPRPRQPSIPAQHIQEYQRRISQSPIPQPSPQPRQMTPRPMLPTPQTHHVVHPAHGQTQMQQQQQPPQQHHQPQPQQAFHQHLQSPHTLSPQMVQSPQLQQSPHITSQPQMQTRRQSLTPQTPTTPQPQVQTQSQHPLHVQPQQMFIPLEPEAEPESEPESEPEADPEPEPELEPLSVPDEPNNFETMASVTQDSTQDELQIEQQSQNEHFHFVNLQDIQNIPPPPPMPAMEFQSIDPRDLTLSFPKPLLDPLPLKRESELEEKDTAMPNAPSPKVEPKQEPFQEPVSRLKEEPIQEPKQEPKQEARPDMLKPKPRKETKVEPPKPWLKSSPKPPPPPKSPSVARSPSITKRSPAPQYKQRPINTGPIMAAVAEECIGKARAQAHDVAMFLDPDDVREYQRLISTGLSCFEGMLQSARLAPREEARTRLRYATVLHEETENIMEAETALTKGIALCDKHRMMDLKYCMQYSMLKLLFQRNHKAALKAVDGHISNCEAFKHVPWYYAFRLLKATFYMEMGNASDTSALENIRAIQNVASTRGDNALSIFASVLEGLTLLKTAKEGSIEKVQSCIAQAAKFQFDPTVRITQLDTLVLLLDFAASLHHQNPDATSAKLRDLQRKIDDCEDWNNVKADFMVPIKKQAASSNIVGQDTASIVDPGDGTSESDNLVITFMTKIELRSLIFMFSGLSSLHKQSSKSTDFWREGSKILETWDEFTLGIPYGPPVSLHTAIKQRQWRIEGQAYITVMLGLLEASHCQWITVKKHMDRLEGLLSDESQPTLKLLALYLSGVYHQGLGELQTALEIFQGDRFTEPLCKSHGLKVGEQEVAMLAGLNRLWIMQHDSCRNDSETVDLIEQLQPLCSGHWNVDLCTAWHNVMAALVTDPPQQLNQQKQHIQAAMGGSKGTGNIVGAAVTLCIMRSRFFENVIGDQALKSARAAAKQAQRSGNVLWQSVADGMLAHSYDVQGQREESRLEWEKATREARDAFKRS